ncbi:uncharacterized protein TM35_000241270 [Trypanosoma theileri]|uniref:Uncharacterized protein n=1 Tax=Trypanosoma theileri TaxID=67003 RepID=A0A1X0NQL1_9TRYP|nr:uncharacterized protein TM35_000241270 [Trypanosoma theileri]ORC86977.1 hypothetical protein TM35_000241270 [Trypanosoma theileri]
MYGVPLECCECAIPIADDGALRAVLLVPCQHLLHVGCVDYIRKRRKLHQLIDGADLNGIVTTTPFLQSSSSDVDATFENANITSTTSSNNSNSKDEKSNTIHSDKHSRIVACPACHSPIQKLIPLFPSIGDMHRPTNDNNSGVALQYGKVHHKQKTNIAHLRALYEQRKNVTQLTRTCALLHERLSEVQAEVDSLSKILPNPLPLVSGSRVSEDELCVDGMTATELELYITQSSSTLERLEREVREQRRLTERRRKKLSSLKSRYHAQKEPTPKRLAGDRIKEGIESSDGEGKCDTLNDCRRPRSAPVVDVDEEEEKEKERKSSAALQVMVVSSVEGSNAEESGSDDNSDDVIFVDQTTPPIASTTSRSDSRGAADATTGGFVYTGQTYPITEYMSPGNINSDNITDSNAADVDDDSDIMRCYNHLQQVTSTRQRTIHPSNAVRLLPRREDRLWQSSLEGLL